MFSQKRNRVLAASFILIPAILLMGRVAYLRATKKTKDFRNAGQVSSPSQIHESRVITVGSPSELAPWQTGGFVASDSPQSAQLMSEVIERAGSGLSAEQRRDL